MNSLWRKESDEVDSVYVDCFVDIDADFINEITDWLLQVCRNFKKPNRPPSVNYNDNLRGRKRQNAAAELENVERYSFRKIARLTEPQQSNTHKQPRTVKRSQRFEPTLDFDNDDKFAGMANVLQIQENIKFGRHITASTYIDVGQIIVASHPFASVCTSPTHRIHCLNCHKIDANFIACEHCNDVWFCNDTCRQTNQTHQRTCNTVFHQIDNSDVKLAVQMILNVIKAFPQVDRLMEHFEALQQANDRTSRFGLLFNLMKCSHDGQTALLRAYRAYKCLITLKDVKIMFISKKTKRFLMHLVLQYVLIIPMNCFSYELDNSPGLYVKSIFDVVSLLNHSCAPNTSYKLEGDISYWVTTRPIKKGEQIFINYLGDRVEHPVVTRQQYIEAHWGFRCECERCKCEQCKQPTHLFNIREMADNQSYRYIYRNYDDRLLPYGSPKRKRLGNECIDFIRVFGYTWSEILDDIIDCFLTAFAD